MGRFVILVLLTVLVFYAITQLPQHPASPAMSTPELLFPTLSRELDQVQQITVQTTAQRFHIVRDATGWRLAEKAHYPALRQKITDLLLALAELRPLEAKTSNPALHAPLDLQDPDANGRAIKLSLQDAQQQTLAALLIGKTSPAKGDAAQFEMYVRKPEADQSWLASSASRIETDPLAWVERAIIALDRQRIRRVMLSPADGNPFSVQRNTLEDKDYHLDPMPEGATLKSAAALSLLVFQAANLTLEDIAAAPADFQAQERYTVETFDGLQINAELAPSATGAQFIARLSAQAIAPTAAEIKPPLLKPEAVAETVRELNTRWSGWVYHLTPLTRSAIFKPLTELATPSASPSGEAAVPQGATVAPEPSSLAAEPFAAPPTVEPAAVEPATGVVEPTVEPVTPIVPADAPPAARETMPSTAPDTAEPTVLTPTAVAPASQAAATPPELAVEPSTTAILEAVPAVPLTLMPSSTLAPPH